MHNRSILTTAIRKGRMTDTQVNALSTLFPLYGLKLQDHSVIDPSLLFKDCTSYVLEIGFGMGHSLIEMAMTSRNCGYLGIELHEPGLGRVLHEIHRHNLTHVKIIQGNAVSAMEKHLSPHIFDTVQIFFPDPWPKKKHWKRRLIQTPTLSLIARVLKSGGRLHIVTDWEHYAEHIMNIISQSPLFKNLHGPSQFAPRSLERPVTHFEKKGLRLGHDIFEIECIRKETL